MSAPRSFRIAAVQAAPVFLDREATVEKACALIGEAAGHGARLVVLPETFVPAYPAWVWVLPLTRRAEVVALHGELVEQSVEVPGPEVERLGRAAREAGAWVAIGINERDREHSRTSLYNTLLVFDSAGDLVSRHRKLMPTGGERLVWTPSERADLSVLETPFGRLSGLICWENYMPLARYALYQQGAQIHVAPTWDKSEAWLASMRHIAREARAWVIGCCQALHMSHVPDRYQFKDAFPRGTEWINVGNSVVVDPEGKFAAGPLEAREGILYADVDPALAAGSRWIFDAAGHYSRSELFEFAVRDGSPPEAPPRGAENEDRESAATPRPRARRSPAPSSRGKPGTPRTAAVRAASVRRSPRRRRAR